jgi:hypothetical protein
MTIYKLKNKSKEGEKKKEGDRYYLENLKCAYCKYKQLDEIYYAPTCNCMTFECEECGKSNFITKDTKGFKSKRIEDVNYEEIYDKYKEYCEEHSIILSRKVEKFMEEELNKKGDK